ncbi:unnamed protein product [Didymodactylos carnosus]|uniref:Transposase n=1 Tax=Didymodactylos carnosus TaxID=1234261 RepID=A0A8S2FLJ8_9BILA|nr:unnamed protein product [Didymodactylos carnosus]CAF4280145.1 unnamed protein product [Didymodactylos carnosus]
MIIFWDEDGVLPPGTTINGPYYASIIERLRFAILEKRRGKVRHGMLLLHDNASVHKSNIGQAAIRQVGFVELNHPAYSPNIAPCDYHLFSNLKKFLRGKNFSSDNEAIGANVKKIIEDSIRRYIERIKALINNHNFSKADRKSQSIRLVRRCLSSYCTKEIADQIEKLDEYQKEVVSRNIVDRYSEMDISGYNSYPPKDIFERFTQVDQTNPVYNETLDKIRTIVLNKFRDELEKAKSKLLPFSENKHIRRFESSVIYASDTITSELEVQLQYCKSSWKKIVAHNFKIRTICSDCEKLSHKIVNDGKLTSEDYNKFNLYYCNLISSRQEITVINPDIQFSIDQIKKYIYLRKLKHGKVLFNIIQLLKMLLYI